MHIIIDLEQKQVETKKDHFQLNKYCKTPLKVDFE